MKNLIKKNQLMITALAIMIAIAGYLQFAGTNLDEEYLKVSDTDVSQNFGFRMWNRFRTGQDMAKRFKH